MYFLNKFLKISVLGNLSFLRENNVDLRLWLKNRITRLFVDRWVFF